jgi:hypothetical protein
MPHIYPPAPPTISGDILTISRFLNSPATVQRRLRTLAENRFISDVLLTGRYETSGGSILYEQNESIFTSKAPKAVNAGAEYPRSPATPGPAALAGVTKWGQDVPITDEHVKRYGRRAVDVAMLKVVNFLTKQVDSVALAAIAAAVTQNAAATGGGGWSGGTADPLLDLALAQAAITSLDQGYDADTVVLSDVNYARLISNAKIVAGLARESDTSVTMTGRVLVVAGLRILSTNNMPVPTTALVLDSSMLGGLAYERLESPEYQGDPANGVESWTRRDPDANDQWLVRGRRPIVPIVQEPNAAYKITGLS